MTVPIYMAATRNYDGRPLDPDRPLHVIRGDEEDASCLLIPHEADQDGDIVIYPVSKPQSAGYSPSHHCVQVPASITEDALDALEDDKTFASLVTALVDPDRDGPDAHVELESYLRCLA